MKLIRISRVGISFGIFLFAITELRYFVLAPDIDKALFFGLIAIMISVLSFMWNEIVRLANTLDDVETYLADLNKQGGK